MADNIRNLMEALRSLPEAARLAGFGVAAFVAVALAVLSIKVPQRRQLTLGLAVLFSTFAIVVLLVGMKPSPSVRCSIAASHGWVYLGPAAPNFTSWREQPYFETTFSSQGQRETVLPTIGDEIRLVKMRRVVIAHVRTRGTQDIFVAPWTLDVLSDDDLTGEYLDPGCTLVVRDVSAGRFPERDPVVWTRVAPQRP